MAWFALLVEGILAAILQKPWMAADSQAYLELARNLSDQGFGLGQGASFEPNGVRPPGYPWFLNLTHIRLGLPLSAIIAFQVGCYLGTVWLFTRYLIRSGHHRLAFLCFSVVYFFPFFYATVLLSEAIAIAVVGGIVVLLDRADERPLFWVLAGALIGLGGLVRADILPLGAALAIVAALKLRPAKALTVTGLAGSVALLLVLPFIFWNGATFNKWTPTPAASAIGQSLWLATWENKLSLKDRQVIYGTEVTSAAVNSGYLAEFQEATARASGDQVRLSNEFGKVAFARIKADPSDMALHSLNAVWRLFVTSEYPLPWQAATLLHILSFGTLALGAWGIGQRQLSPVSLIVLLAVLIPHLPLHTEARYTAPLRPILLFYASYGLLDLWRRIVAGQGKPLSQGSTA